MDENDISKRKQGLFSRALDIVFFYEQYLKTRAYKPKEYKELPRQVYSQDHPIDRMKGD